MSCLISPSEWRWALLWTTVTLLFVNVPNLLGWTLSTPEARFGGAAYNVEDVNSYIAKMRQGARGEWLFHIPYTSEEHTGTIIYIFYLLLGKLARERVGYVLTRWMGHRPYPRESVGGPIVILTNEQAGSDGDIFCHAAKLIKLGKLIGRRTWGGVIGIWPRNALVDGTITTQPEFSHWFKDVGWGVENYGTDPDIEVDILPQDYAQDADPQLDRAIEEVLKDIEVNPPLEPDFGNRPRRTLPG